MKVWVLYGNHEMQEIFDRKPSLADIRDFARERGWPGDVINTWRVEERPVRVSTAL